MTEVIIMKEKKVKMDLTDLHTFHHNIQKQELKWERTSRKHQHFVPICASSISCER